jgi:beta-phosphoglucomutase-like phosphatase (HAD superfamily)
VKEMNKMVAYAKAATIRERQLEEKKRDWEDFKAQEKKKDKIMELERLKKIKEQQEIDVQKHEEALKGREVIVDQIKQREIDRVKQKEEQEREAQVLVQKMKDMEKEDKLKY